MEHQDEDSSYLYKEACPACGSCDNLARYSDGHGYCFGCKHYEHGTEGATTQTHKTSSPAAGLLAGEYGPIPTRRISEEVCRKFGYQTGYHGDRKVHLANYYNHDRDVVAQKVRYGDKTFVARGDFKAKPLFGMHLFTSGKQIVITEGEIDCLSVAEVNGKGKWPIVSIPNGSAGAKAALSKNLEYLDKFESVILMFDMDEPGRAATAECAALFPPGRCKIAVLPLKDASECLVAGRGEEIISAVWNAKPYRPDGLVGVADLLDDLDKPIVQGLPWFLPTLTKLTFGRRYGEVYGFGAGTGIGKTDFLTQQIDYDISELKEKVGLIFLEQKPIETVIRIAGKHAGKRFHVPDGSWTSAERKAEVEKMAGLATLYDSFGQTDWKVVASKIRFMAVSEGIKLIYLDHLTAMADTGDERGSIEQIMKEMSGLANELQIIIHFVSHLATPEGKSHEEGGHVAIKHFKGSRAIGFWSYFMFGLERDQQHKDLAVRSVTRFRILKDRYTGQATGNVIYLGYEQKTGRLFETTEPVSSSAAAVFAAESDF